MLRLITVGTDALSKRRLQHFQQLHAVIRLEMPMKQLRFPIFFQNKIRQKNFTRCKTTAAKLTNRD